MNSVTALGPTKSTSEISLDSLETGIQEEPFSIFLMGVPGVGKSTFAAGAPKPVFLDIENGTAHLSVARWRIASYEQSLAALDVLATKPHDFRTVVVDGVGQLEEHIHGKVLAAANGKWKSITEYGGGYGKGPDAAMQFWDPFFKRLESLRASRGMHVLLLGHVAQKNFKNPFGPDWERHVPKMKDPVAGRIREKFSYVLFARFETFANKSDEDKRVRGISSGTRILHTQWSAAFDAKNRGDLPPELPLEWSAFETAVREGGPGALVRLEREFKEVVERLPDDRREKARAAVTEAINAKDVGKLAKLVDYARGLLMTTETTQKQEGDQ